jgi:hypothetical protein
MAAVAPDPRAYLPYAADALLRARRAGEPR